MISTPKRRWFQFSLLRLLIFMTALCVASAALWQLVIAPAERQREAVLVIERLGGKAYYESSPEESSWPIRQLRRWLPRHYFYSVEYINLDGTSAADADLAHFRGLSQLGTLYLRGTNVTDAGVAQLGDLRELLTLDLSETKITDSGLEHLQNHSKLRVLFLDETKVTDAGLARLAEHNTLVELSLRKTAISDAGLAHLHGLNLLHGLDLADTQVTDAGVARFQQPSREYVIIRSSLSKVNP